MHNDLTNLQFCKGCHQPFLGPKMVMRQDTGNLIHNEYCPDCVQRYQDQREFIQQTQEDERNLQEDEKFQAYCAWYVQDYERREEERIRQEQLRREPRYSNPEPTHYVEAGCVVFLFGPPIDLQPFLRRPQGDEFWRNMYLVEGTATLTKRSYHITKGEIEGIEYTLTPSNSTPITFCISQGKWDKEPAFSDSAEEEGARTW